MNRLKISNSISDRNNVKLYILHKISHLNHIALIARISLNDHSEILNETSLSQSFRLQFLIMSAPSSPNPKPSPTVSMNQEIDSSAIVTDAIPVSIVHPPTS
jgi:hypothetical protein